MTMFLENPLPGLLIGGLTAAILGGGWIQTGYRWLLIAMVLAILLTIGGVLVERFVVTEREEVETTLHAIADLVEQNQIDAALRYAHSQYPQVRNEAAGELPQYRFRRVEIKRNLGIAVFPQEHPPRATAEFNVVVELDVPQLQIQDRRIPRYVEVTFRRDQDGQWRVTDYRHDDPRQGFTIDRVP